MAPWDDRGFPLRESVGCSNGRAVCPAIPAARLRKNGFHSCEGGSPGPPDRRLLVESQRDFAGVARRSAQAVDRCSGAGLAAVSYGSGR